MVSKLILWKAGAEHPLLVEAFADRLRAVWRPELPVLFTAHSVPCRTIQAAQPPAADAPQVIPVTATNEPDPYPIDAKRTAAAVAAKFAEAGLTEDRWFFAFQSQGMSSGPWLGPSVEDTLKALRAAGHDEVMVHPIGFLCDHVEILYDIDIGFREFGATNRSEDFAAGVAEQLADPDRGAGRCGADAA